MCKSDAGLTNKNFSRFDSYVLDWLDHVEQLYKNQGKTSECYKLLERESQRERESNMFKPENTTQWPLGRVVRSPIKLTQD